MSIKAKLVGFNMFTCLLGLSLACVAFITIGIQDAKVSLKNNMILLSKVKSEDISTALFFNQTKVIKERISSLQEKEGILILCVYDASGTVVAEYRVSDHQCSYQSKQMHNFSWSAFTLSQPIIHEGIPVGTIYLKLSLDKIKGDIYKQISTVFIIFLVLVILCYVIVNRLQRVFSDPIRNLVETANKISLGDYSTRVKSYGKDEFSVLAKTFNKMMQVMQKYKEGLEEKVEAGRIDLKKTNDELEQANHKLEKANEELTGALEVKERFIKNMNHEINTPAHQLSGLSQFVLDDLLKLQEKMSEYIEKEGSGDEGKKLIESLSYVVGYADKLALSCEREANFIRNINSISALAEGRVHYHIEESDLSEAIKEALLSYPRHSERFVYEKTENLLCLFDKNKIKSVLDHLFSNALIYAPEGKITITTKKSKYRKPDGSPSVGIKCSVHDEGPGIPEKELEYIFDKFTESSRTKTEAGGRGLGLAICKGLILGHGGIIWAENAKGKGAIFHFIIPVA